MRRRFRCPALAAEEGEGLWAEYYSGRSFETYAGGGVEQTVDHEWTEGAPPPGFSGVENFSARWVGRILAEEDGTYAIYANVDDGAQIYADI